MLKKRRERTYRLDLQEGSPGLFGGMPDGLPPNLEHGCWN